MSRHGRRTGAWNWFTVREAMSVAVRTAGLAAALALVLAGCATTPPEEDPVQIKLNDLDTRLTRIERVMQNQSLLELSNQLEALRADVRGMHNDVDLLNNSMESLRKQQRDMYTDLDQRMKALEARGGGGAGAPAAIDIGSSPGSSAGVTPPTDTSVYQKAFALLKDGQYDRAVQAFKDFLFNFPSSSLADNAQYWLGEAYYVNRSYPEAQSAFQRVVDKYPQSQKIPDALLKIGYCRYEMKLFDSAKAVLQQVVNQYPDAPAAKLARERLDRMAAEKH
jgi:tol-pal system protein YbgF